MVPRVPTPPPGEVVLSHWLGSAALAPSPPRSASHLGAQAPAARGVGVRGGGKEREGRGASARLPESTVLPRVPRATRATLSPA